MAKHNNKLERKNQQLENLKWEVKQVYRYPSVSYDGYREEGNVILFC